MRRWSNRRWNLFAAVIIVTLTAAVFAVGPFLSRGAATLVAVGAMAAVVVVAVVALAGIRRNGQS